MINKRLNNKISYALKCDIIYCKMSTLVIGKTCRYRDSSMSPSSSLSNVIRKTLKIHI